MVTTFETSDQRAGHLQPTSQDPRMPFSSPMGEEVLSPTSPKMQYNNPAARRKGSQGSIGSTNDSPSRRRFSIQKPSRDRTRRMQEKPPNRARLAGLNIVTNFSKPPMLAHRATTIDSQENSPKETQPQAMILPNRAYSGPKKHSREQKGANSNGSKPSNQTRADSKDMDGLSIQRLHNPENLTSQIVTNIKGPVNSLKRKSNRMSGLSPYDRLIAIGIAVTPTSIDQRTRSPGVVREHPPCLTIRQHAGIQANPVTPSIIVTPAKEEAPWSAASGDRLGPYQPRPASSLYSQVTHRGRAATQPSVIPPVPTIPDASIYQKPRNASDPHIKSDSRKPSERVISTCTVFEDDSPPTGVRDRSESGESQLWILPRPSMDSISTRHRSQGWWNYIISPFSAKPSTPGFPVHEEDRDVPELDSPHSSDVTRIGEELDEDTQDKKVGCSPPMQGSVRSDITHTSIRTDGSHLDEERGAFSPAFYDPLTNDTTSNHPRDPGIGDPLESPLSPEGFGAAAEYYQACWHDQNSPTPYFQCQNHTCLTFPATRPTQERATFGTPKNQDASEREASRGVPEDGRDPSQPAVFHQAPANRFSAAFKQAVTPEARPTSEATIIEDVDSTPEVEEAHVAPVLRALAPVPAPQAPPAEPIVEQSRDFEHPAHPEAPPLELGQERALSPVEEPQIAHDTPPEPVPLAASKEPVKRFVAVMSSLLPEPVPGPSITIEPTSQAGPPQLPGIMSRQAPASEPSPQAVQKEHASKSKLPLAVIHPASDQRPFYIVNHYHGDYPPRPSLEQQHTFSDLYPPPRDKSTTDENREKLQRIEIELNEEKRKQKSSHGGLFKCCNCFTRKKPVQKKKKKWLLIALAIVLILLIVLILALAMTLTRKGDKMPVQTQWLNITGFPPISTGISTIIAPDAVYEQSSCVSPTTMWSCALPKDEQVSVAPNSPDLPNFRVEIRFQNGTNVSSGTNASLHKRFNGHAPNAVSAGQLIRRNLLHVRDSFTNSLFTPSPAPSSLEDQAFLGNTTDNVTAPFDGEVTPFFMSFGSANKLSPRLLKRGDGLTNSTNSTDPLPDLTSAIPSPDTKSDGTAAPANLLPFPSSQPLRLFDRGRPTEHYGFYTYFDRSIFLASTAVLNSTTELVGNIPGDENGGAQETGATVRCTWAQTRFLVQIWTNRGGTASLLMSGNSTSANGTNANPKNLTQSSANDFNRPGSFPYPVSITLDRHGGDIKTKEIYCYGVDNRQRIITSQKKLQLEDRAFQGQLVNPSLGPFGHVNVSTSEGGPGGIDGGTGGCGCVWRNWQGAQ
jgi:hypothetical protein